MRRGFKTEARALAQEVRAELCLGPLARLVPRVLAAHLGIPILSVTDFVADYPEVRYLLDGGRKDFSAVTVFCGTRRTIVHNDAHAVGRQSSNLAHELAHGLLGHPPTPALDDRGCRHWSQEIEDEASWLAGELLMTEAAALAVARGHWSRAEAARVLNLSEDMVQFRVNATGAVKRTHRSRDARRTASRL